MVIDTSALIAILLSEPQADRLVAALEADPVHLVSTATVLETSIVVLGRFGEVGEPQLDRLLRGIGADVVPVGEEQLVIARDAALRFGRGRHKAALNFGDCLSYALAVTRGEQLLFVGVDFAKTDVVPCPW